jgi:hypothetical protein
VRQVRSQAERLSEEATAAIRLLAGRTRKSRSLSSHAASQVPVA